MPGPKYCENLLRPAALDRRQDVGRDRIPVADGRVAGDEDRGQARPRSDAQAVQARRGAVDEQVEDHPGRRIAVVDLGAHVGAEGLLRELAGAERERGNDDAQELGLHARRRRRGRIAELDGDGVVAVGGDGNGAANRVGAGAAREQRGIERHGAGCARGAGQAAGAGRASIRGSACAAGARPPAGRSAANAGAAAGAGVVGRSRRAAWPAAPPPAPQVQPAEPPTPVDPPDPAGVHGLVRTAAATRYGDQEKGGETFRSVSEHTS